MAVIKKLDYEISGNVGNLTYAKCYGQPVVKVRVRENKSNTKKQQKQRYLYGQLQYLGSVWLDGYINPYFCYDRKEKHAYREFIKYNWQRWDKTGKACFQSIPFFNYGQFLQFVEASGNYLRNIKIEFDKKFYLKYKDVFPNEIIMHTLAVYDFNKQFVKKSVMKATQETADFKAYEGMNELDEKIRRDVADGNAKLMLMFFVKNIDADTGKEKLVPVQNPVFYDENLTLLQPLVDKELFYENEIIVEGNGRAIAIPNIAKRGEEVKLWYFEDDNSQLENINILKGKITRQEIINGVFTMKDSDNKILFTFTVHEEDDLMLPIGCVMAFPQETHNENWKPCYGQTLDIADYPILAELPVVQKISVSQFKLPDLRECVIVGAGRNENLNITAHDVFKVAEFKNDQMQGHTHNINNAMVGAAENYGGYVQTKSSVEGNITLTNKLSAPVAQGANGTPRTGTVTRTKQYGLIWYMKVKM